MSTPVLKERILSDLSGEIGISNDPPQQWSPCGSVAGLSNLSSPLASRETVDPQVNYCHSTSVEEEGERASGDAWQTVGPLEFVRLKLRARSESPWALHVESEAQDFVLSEAERAQMRKAGNVAWAEATRLAAEARRAEQSSQMAAKRDAERLFLQIAKAMEEKRVRDLQESKRRNRDARQRAYNEHQRIVEALRQANSKVTGTDRARAEEESVNAGRRALSACIERRQRSLQCANEALSIAHKRKAEEEARQLRDHQSYECKAQQHQNALREQERQFADSLRRQQEARQERANFIASSISPTQKETDMRHRELLCDVASASATESSSILGASQRSLRRDSNHRLMEERKVEIDRKKQQREEQRQSVLSEGLRQIEQDCRDRDEAARAARALKQAKQKEFRESLEHIQKMKLRRIIEEELAQ